MSRRSALTSLFVVAMLSCMASAQDSKENAEFKLALGLYNDGMFDLATEQLKGFVSHYPSTSQAIEARFFLGLAQLKLKRYDDARLTFQNFALSYVDHPKAAEAWLYIGESHLGAGNEREAASAFERVKVFHPKSDLAPEALIRAGSLFRKLGDRDAARKSFRAILQEYSSSKHVLAARLAIGEMYAEEGQLDLAEKEARRVAESDAPDAVKSAALFAIGTMQANACLFHQAIETFTSVSTLYKGTPLASRALLERSRIEILKGNESEVLQRIKTIAESNQLDDTLQSNALFILGKAYAGNRDYSSAQKSFEKLVSRYPTSPLMEEALLQAVWCAYSHGAYSVALKHAKKLASLPSGRYTSKALALGAQSASKLKLHSDATLMFRTLLERSPDGRHTAAILFLLGNMLQEGAQDYRGAASSFEQVYQKDQSSPLAVDALIRLGESQEALNDFDGALQSYLELQARYPASHQRSVIEPRIERMRSSTLRHRDSTMSRLARLMSEMLSDQPKALLAFQLGKIYFRDLNDYAAAAIQFSKAIEAGISGDDAAEAEFLRVQSLHRSMTDSSQLKGIIAQYDAFLQKHPGSPWSEEAAYISFTYKFPGSSLEERVALTDDYIAQHPASPHREEMSFAVAKQAFELNKQKEAIQLLQQFKTTYPASASIAEAQYYLGSVYHSAGLHDSALSQWQEGSTASPVTKFTVMCLRKLAAAYEDAKLFGEAIDQWKRVIGDFGYTDDGLDRQRLAKCLINNGNTDEAIALLRDMYENERTSPFSADSIGSGETLFLLARAYELKGNRQLARQSYATYVNGVAHGSRTNEAFYQLGKLAQAEGNVTLASAYFKQAAVAGKPDRATQEIADLLFQAGQYNEAAEQYAQLSAQTDSSERKRSYSSRRIVALLRTDKIVEAQKEITLFGKAFGNPREEMAEFEYEKGSAFFRKNDYVNAKKHFTNVKDDFEKTRFEPWGVYYLGKIAEVGSKPEDAAKTYETVLEKYPDSDVTPRALLSLGNMHFNVERFDHAIRHYRRIVAEPERAGEILPYALNNLIEAYESTKLYDEALKMTREYIQRYPTDENLLDKKIKLGTLYTKIGYYDQAILHFQNLLDEAGSLLEAELRYNIGEAYYYKGDYQQAILEFLKVPYLASRQGKVDWTATSFYMAGQAYEKMSRFDEAVGMYQQIVERTGIDATFRAAARKEIDRVKGIAKKDSR